MGVAQQRLTMAQDAMRGLLRLSFLSVLSVLASQEAPNRTILCAGAGTFEAAHITMTHGAWIGTDALAPVRLAGHLAEVTDRTGETVPQSGSAQGTNEVTKAMENTARAA